MGDKPRYFEQAADALEQAMTATHFDEQAKWLDEALRLNRMALAQERGKRRYADAKEQLARMRRLTLANQDIRAQAETRLADSRRALKSASESMDWPPERKAP